MQVQFAVCSLLGCAEKGLIGPPSNFETGLVGLASLVNGPETGLTTGLCGRLVTGIFDTGLDGPASLVLNIFL